MIITLLLHTCSEWQWRNWTKKIAETNNSARVDDLKLLLVMQNYLNLKKYFVVDCNAVILGITLSLKGFNINSLYWVS